MPTVGHAIVHRLALFVFLKSQFFLGGGIEVRFRKQKGAHLLYLSTCLHAINSHFWLIAYVCTWNYSTSCVNEALLYCTLRLFVHSTHRLVQYPMVCCRCSLSSAVSSVHFFFLTSGVTTIERVRPRGSVMMSRRVCSCQGESTTAITKATDRRNTRT